MRCKAIPATLLSLLMVLFAAGINARAADESEDEYDVTARVIRISLIKGDVSVKRQGSEELESAKINVPLVEGDTITTGSDARVEIQIDARNFVRVAGDSVLKIVTLRNEGIALSLSRGTAAIRLARFDHDHEYFEIDAPKTTIAAETKGLYRIDVDQNGRIQVTVREEGRARIYSETSGFVVRDGHSATLEAVAGDEGDWHFAYAPAKDSWDDWITSREADLTARLRYDNRVRYYDSDIWGAEELDAYGDWVYANDYGWIWRPHVTVINAYNNWAPYRYGDWTWCPPYGWTWVGQEPWGWAPYHYGRWVYYNNYWAWCPRSYNQHRSWWRPALVAFFSIDINFGSEVCWYPLSYRQRDPRSRHYDRNDRDPRRHSDDDDDRRRHNPAYWRAVTGIRERDFGRGGPRSHPANPGVARRVIDANPSPDNLPARRSFRPNDTDPGSGRTRREGEIARRGRMPSLPERPTGAADRTPGIPLDGELRRTRILNGRNPRSDTAAIPVNPGAVETVPTGAVERPFRRQREPNGADSEGNRRLDRNANPGQGSVRPDRIDRRRPVENNPPEPGELHPPTSAPPSVPSGEGAPERRGRTDRRERSDPGDRPNRRGDDAPTPQSPSASEPPTQRPGRTERPDRPEPSPRSEPRANPEPRPERPERSDPSPRSEPAPRSEPPSRSEPPQRSEPPPSRSEPEPQRSEPPPQRSEPSKPAEDRPSRADRKNDG